MSMHNQEFSDGLELAGVEKKTHLVVVACNGLSQVMLALDSKGFSALDLAKVLLPAVCSTCSIYISSSVFLNIHHFNTRPSNV